MKRRIAAVCLLVLGLCIAAYPAVSDFVHLLGQSKAIVSYEKAVADSTDEQYAVAMSNARAYNHFIAQANGLETLLTDEQEALYAAALNLRDDGIMGYIEIPAASIRLPVYHTVEEDVLQVGAGHVPTSSLPIGGPSTHSVLSGHRGITRWLRETFIIDILRDFQIFIGCILLILYPRIELLFVHRIKVVARFDLGLLCRNTIID